MSVLSPNQTIDEPKTYQISGSRGDHQGIVDTTKDGFQEGSSFLEHRAMCI